MLNWLTLFYLGIHLRKESDKYENLTGTLTQNKRKVRKRRAHNTRTSIAGPEKTGTIRQMSRSKTTEKMIAPPTPVRSKIYTLILLPPIYSNCSEILNTFFLSFLY